MVTLSQVQNGLVKYLDTEIMPQINGWQKWVFGAAMSVSLSKAANILNELKENAFIKMLDIIDENDKIDIDTIYQEFRKQAQKGPVTFNVPIVNLPLTLNSADIDKMYQLIKGGEY